MDQRNDGSRNGSARPDERRCDTELHVALCARRLSTGHLQFHWRIEHVDNLVQDGTSLEGSWGPFTAPHEAGQDVAAAVREWWKASVVSVATHQGATLRETEGTQLTLRDFMAD